MAASATMDTISLQTENACVSPYTKDPSRIVTEEVASSSASVASRTNSRDSSTSSQTKKLNPSARPFTNGSIRSVSEDSRPSTSGASSNGPSNRSLNPSARSFANASARSVSEDSRPSTSGACSNASSSRSLNPSAKAFTITSVAEESYSTPPEPIATHLFELCHTPDKGMGLFATAFIPVGTRIICEQPLLRISKNKQHLAWTSYCKLNSRQKAVFDSLSRCSGNNQFLEQASRFHLISPEDDDEKIEADVAEHVRVMSTFACNNFLLGTKGQGVFETASRINHSCRPNVYHCWNAMLQRETVHAIVDINPGEEVLTTYIGNGASYVPHEQRQDQLLQHYGFLCSCGACSDPTGQSDGLREAMSAIVWGLEQYRQGAPKTNQFIPETPTEAWLMAEDIIALLVREGLHYLELAKACCTASVLALNCNEAKKALRYANQEVAIEKNCLGTELDDLKAKGVTALCWLRHVDRVIEGYETPAASALKTNKQPKTEEQKAADREKKKRKLARKREEAEALQKAQSAGK